MQVRALRQSEVVALSLAETAVVVTGLVTILGVCHPPVSSWCIDLVFGTYCVADVVRLQALRLGGPAVEHFREYSQAALRQLDP